MTWIDRLLNAIAGSPDPLTSPPVPTPPARRPLVLASESVTEPVFTEREHRFRAELDGLSDRLTPDQKASLAQAGPLEVFKLLVTTRFPVSVEEVDAAARSVPQARPTDTKHR